MDPNGIDHKLAAGQPEFKAPAPGKSIMPTSRRGNHIVRHYQGEQPVIPQTTRVAKPITVNTTPEQAAQAAAIASSAFKPIVPGVTVASVPAVAYDAQGNQIGGVAVDASGAEQAPKSHKALIIVLAIIGILLLTAAGVAAYYMAVVNSPANVLKTALVNELSGYVTTQKYDGSVRIGQPGTASAINGTFSGGVSQTGASSFSGTVTLGKNSTSIQTATSDGRQIFVKGTGLENLTALLERGAPQATVQDQAATKKLSAAFAALNNQWYQTDPATLSTVSSVNPSRLLTTNLKASDVTQVENAYAKYPFLHISQTLADQTVSGQLSHHYRLQMDNTQLEAFILAIQNAKIASFTPSAAVVQSWQNTLGHTSLATWPLDAWVGTSSHVFTKLALTNTAGKSSATPTIQINLHDFNQPLTVTEPDSSKPLNMSLAQLLTASPSL